MKIRGLMSLGTFIEGPYRQARKNEISATTYSNMVSYCRNNLPFYNKNLLFITDREMKDWLDSKNHIVKALSINNEIYTVFKYAKKLRYHFRNPISKVKLPPSNKIGKVIKAEDIKRILDYTKKYNHRFYRIILLSFYGGLRRAEACGVKREFVYRDTNSIKICGQIVREESTEPYYTTQLKGHASYRTVTYPKWVIDELLSYNEESEYLVEGFKYDFIDCNYPSAKFGEVLKELGLESRRFHDLRHTHISILFKAGVDPVLISKRVGHAKLSTTLDTYTHILLEEEEETIDALNNYIPSLE